MADSSVKLAQQDPSGAKIGPSGAPEDDPSTKDDGNRTVTLSHHLNVGEDGLPASLDNPAVKSLMPGAKMSVPRAVASAMIHAGYTTIHPDDQEAVNKALK